MIVLPFRSANSRPISPFFLSETRYLLVSLLLVPDVFSSLPENERARSTVIKSSMNIPAGEKKPPVQPVV